jgi:pimeloyl-ACP methyl ester carboxylesterase
VLEVDGSGPEHPVLFVHGNPTNAEDWTPFLERLDGRRRALAPDLLGWGKSDRPESFRWTVDSLASWLGDVVDALGVTRFDIVVHDWGAVGLVMAARRPDAVDRVAVLNAVPLSSDFRWHLVGRLWRRRGVGELLNATMSRFGTRQLLRQATPRSGSLPVVVDLTHAHLDAGTKRAILELYRDADPDKLGVLGEEVARLTGPALVVWGDADPYIAPSFADVYAAVLGGEARVVHLPDAGHWVWLDRPDAVETVCDFLGAPTK